MNLNQSLALESLQRGNQKDGRIGRVKKTARILAREVVRRSESVGLHPDTWRETWLGSKSFRLMNVPLNLLAIPTATVTSSKALGAMYAVSDRLDDVAVVVDVNKGGVGETPTGFKPKVIVVAGSIQASGAQLRGNTSILAWVGDKAAIHLGKVLADHQLGANELRDLVAKELKDSYPRMFGPRMGEVNVVNQPMAYIDDVYPLENYFVFNYDGRKFRHRYKVNLAKRNVRLVGNPTEVVQKYVKKAGGTPMEAAMVLHGQVPSSLSEGGGGGVVRQPVTPRSQKFVGGLRSKKKRKKKMRGQGYQNLGDDESETSVVQKKKARGGTYSKNAAVMKVLDVKAAKRMCSAYVRATKGQRVGKIYTKSPPGCEHIVKGLKKAGKSKTSAYKIAWWAKKEGRC